MTEQHAEPGKYPAQQGSTAETQQSANSRSDGAEPAESAALPPSPAVQSLLSMFPGTDRTTVETILEAHANDSNAAVTVLLSMNDPDYRPSQQDEHAVHSAEMSRRTASMYLHSPPRTQTWDPHKLSYQPRVRRPRTIPGNVNQGNHAAYYAAEKPGVQHVDLREYEARIANAAADGMAKMGSKLSQLKQRAESTLRNLPEGGVRQKIQESSLFRRTPAGTPDRHTRARTQMNSAGFGVGGTYPYDNDPELVRELDLDQILTAPLPAPPKKQDNWGQRYTGAENLKQNRNLPDTPLEGWDAAGHVESDEEAPELPPKGKDAPSACKSTSETSGKPAAASAKDAKQPSATETAEQCPKSEPNADAAPKDEPSDASATKAAPESSQDPGVDPSSDREYVTNPFEDDD